jgi:hypothetical protein
MSKPIKQVDSLRQMLRSSIIKRLKKNIVHSGVLEFKYNIDELDIIIKKASVMTISELKVAKELNLHSKNDSQIDEFYDALITSFV